MSLPVIIFEGQLSVQGAAVVISIPVPVRLCPSGLVMVTSCMPGVAPLVDIFSVTCVGSVKVTLLTTTPPVTLAEI